MIPEARDVGRSPGLPKLAFFGLRPQRRAPRLALEPRRRRVRPGPSVTRDDGVHRMWRDEQQRAHRWKRRIEAGDAQAARAESKRDGAKRGDG